MARGRRGSSIGCIALVAAACGGGSRQSEDATVSLPTSITATGDDGGESTTEADGAGDETAAEKLDMGGDPTGTSGFDPDGPTTCEQDVDIVFVMDVSTSMDGFLNALASDIAAVDQAIQALELPGEPHYGLVVFVDDFAILNTGAPYPVIPTLQADFNEWADFTASNQQVAGGNLNSTWPENSLDALHAAATVFQWRPAADTLRIVIHTTDDTFWEGPSTQNGVDIQRGYDEVVTALQEQQIRVFSYTAQIGGMCECENVTPGWSAPYAGKTAIPEATGGAVYDIDLVLAGQASLADAIPDAVEETMCDPYPPVG
jgi:hypothetical protein